MGWLPTSSSNCAYTTLSIIVLAGIHLIYRAEALTVAPMPTPKTTTGKKTYDLLVIGGGSAGLTAAKFAKTFGKSVAIIEKERMGGDCTWTGCIPSKSLIASSKVSHMVRSASKDLGVVAGADVVVDMEAIQSRVQGTIQRIFEEDDSPEAMEKLGIDTIKGRAVFQERNVLQIVSEGSKTGSTTVTAKYGVLICTGASPRNPNNDDIPGLDSIDYITYENAFDLKKVPKDMTVVGGGPIGVELAQAYARLGSKVTVIAKSLLPREEPEAGKMLQRVFEKEGITVVNSKLSRVELLTSNNTRHHKCYCENGESITGSLMLLALGRKPVVDGLGLSRVGVQLNAAGGIDVDKNLQTSCRGIYAAGDCTGVEQYTHYAG